MARKDFIDQLRQLGYAVEDLGENRLAIRFTAPVGKSINQTIKLGFVVDDGFPSTCPSGPHLSPRLGHSLGNVHSSPFGSDWEYWSRPFPSWGSSNHTVRAYMAHIRHLFENQ